MALKRLKRTLPHLAPLTRALFGVRVPHPTSQGHWDYSTLVLFSELKKRVRPGHRVLELGTGEAGILSIAMAGRIRANYLALDVAEEAVTSARVVAAANKVEVEFRQSDLFAAVSADEEFDIVFFNPPYLPQSQSDFWRGQGEPARVWDGGVDGLDVIRRFWIEAGARRQKIATVLLGFNRKAVTEARVAGLGLRQGFAVTDSIRAFHPGTVMVFSGAEVAIKRDPRNTRSRRGLEGRWQVSTRVTPGRPAWIA